MANFDGETTLITDSHAIPGYQPAAPVLDVASAQMRTPSDPSRASDTHRAQVRTVAPVSTEPPRGRRVRKSTEVIAALVAIVVAIGGLAGVAIGVSRYATRPSTTPSAAREIEAASTPVSAAHVVTPSPSEQASSALPSPLETSTPSAVPGDPSASSSATAKTKKKPPSNGSGAAGTPKPRPPQEDVLGTYKRPPGR